MLRLLLLVGILLLTVFSLIQSVTSDTPGPPAALLASVRSNSVIQIQVRLPLNFAEANVTHFFLATPCWKVYWGRGGSPPNRNFWKYVPGPPDDVWGTADVTKSTSLTGQCVFYESTGCANVPNLKVHAIRRPNGEMVGFGTCCGETNYYRGGQGTASFGMYDECETMSCGIPGNEHSSCS